MIVPSAALRGKQLVLGVTGSIACYKAIEVASHLTQLGVLVHTVLTDNAARFVTPLAFQAVTGQPAYAGAALWGQEAHILHTRLARQAELLAIAPATAHTLARLAQGQADNLLLVTALASGSPLLLAPAMDGGMWEHPATQANVSVLRRRGAIVLGPDDGHLASGQTGRGRLVAPEAIVGRIRALLGQAGALAQAKIVVTAGGTREPLDVVRHIANRSSGKQGAALAQAARDRGADVTLVSTAPVAPETGNATLQVNTAREMREAVRAACRQADVLIMAAAVADFRPAAVHARKLQKADGPPALSLAPNPDILHEISAGAPRDGRPRVVVGFAAETHDGPARARQKLRAKNLDLMVVNDVGRSDIGFGAEHNAAHILDRQGGIEELPRMPKFALAERILERVARLLAQSP